MSDNKHTQDYLQKETYVTPNRIQTLVRLKPFQRWQERKHQTSKPKDHTNATQKAVTEHKKRTNEQEQFEQFLKLPY